MSKCLHASKHFPEFQSPAVRINWFRQYSKVRSHVIQSFDQGSNSRAKKFPALQFEIVMSFFGRFAKKLKKLWHWIIWIATANNLMGLHQLMNLKERRFLLLPLLLGAIPYYFNLRHVFEFVGTFVQRLFSVSLFGTLHNRKYHSVVLSAPINDCYTHSLFFSGATQSVGRSVRVAVIFIIDSVAQASYLHSIYVQYTLAILLIYVILFGADVR